MTNQKPTKVSSNPVKNIIKNNDNFEKRPHVVIVGAGFGGIETAKSLGNTAIDVTIIDRNNFHLFQPLLYQVATSTLSASEIAIPIRNILKDKKNISVYMDTVNNIDTAQKTVTTANHGSMSYDYLVLATGARHSYFGNDQWEQFAPGLKEVSDAFMLRSQILTAFEKAEMEKESTEKRQELMTFVIVGAGPTGCEMAGALAEMAYTCLAKEFHSIDAREAKIILVEGGNRVLPQFRESLSRVAQSSLQKMGVEVMLNSTVSDIKKGKVTIDGKIIKTENIIWAAGVQASPMGKWMGVETERNGKIIVNHSLNISNDDTVFAVGDTASYTPKGTNLPLPGVAPVAKQMGRFVGQTILSRETNSQYPKTLKPFSYQNYGTMAVLGRNSAIADFGFMRIKGWMGFWLWGFAHIYFLAGWSNRMATYMRWIFSYLGHNFSSRIIHHMTRKSN